MCVYLCACVCLCVHACVCVCVCVKFDRNGTTIAKQQNHSHTQLSSYQEFDIFMLTPLLLCISSGGHVQAGIDSEDP